MTADAEHESTLVRTPPAEPAAPAWIFRVTHHGETVIRGIIALLLLVLAAIVLYETAKDLITSDQLFPGAVTLAVNSVLFVIILLEILRTVLATFIDASLQLVPFIAIGIISAVRHILTVGSELTVGPDKSEVFFRHSIIELGVNAGVALALVASLMLLRWQRS